jgi:hypothetical protein
MIVMMSESMVLGVRAIQTMSLIQLVGRFEKPRRSRSSECCNSWTQEGIRLGRVYLMKTES